MKLFYTPGACSLASHIIATEVGLKLEIERVDLATKTTEHGQDFMQITRKGYVPALQLDNGHVLTEGVAILQYLADLEPSKHLAPVNGTWERYELQAWLAYINSELHKSYGPLFRPTISAEARAERVAYLAKRYELIEQELTAKPYLMGDHFTVADAYLFTVTNWAQHLKVDLSAFPHLAAFQGRVAGRAATLTAMKAEGLIS